MYTLQKLYQALFGNCLCEIGHVISEGESLSSGWVFNSQKSITKVTSRDKLQHPGS